MIRLAIFAAVVAAPCALAAEVETTRGTDLGVAQASTATTSAASTFNQTYDPTNAFDGYWYPASRAIDGQEDR